jgi:putative nucleotidyltransferase with HDIG domain
LIARSAADAARPASESAHVVALIAAVASAATAVLVLSAAGAWTAVSGRPLAVGVFLAISVALMLAAVDVYGRGSITVAGIGLLLVGFTFGIGAAAFTGILVAVVHGVRRRSRVHKILFNAGNFALAAAAGAGVYALWGHEGSALASLAPAFAAGVVFWAVNIGLITLAMSFSEGLDPWFVWNERFRWLTLHYLAFGPLALASTVAYDKVGLTGLIAFIVPPALLMLSVQQYLEKTRESVESLQQANAELAQRNADLNDLFEFAAGLAAQKHDRHELAAGVQAAIERLTGARASVTLGALVEQSSTPLISGGRVVGGLNIEGGDEERWERLRDAILPQLSTALESTLLVDQVRKTHLETIAALSRSMEAKDLYTGGHTERVSSVAVALAMRLGYRGADLDAIQIGALLHDIGKIGVPERILHKEGPLDENEWVVMRNHPVISEYILSEVDLSPIVLEIARNSHERFDGQGYPDGLGGEQIPLPARIVLVADAFDALTSDRPYRGSRPAPAALDELRAHSGTQFCPRVVEAMEQLWREEPHLLIGEPLLHGVA